MPSLLRRRPQDPVALAWFAACVTGFLVLCWLQRHFVTDDAWITARYADNLAEGLDFGWNPGGQRVEGFSNPALVVVGALADVVGIAPVTAARIVGVGCGIALLVLLHRRAPAVVGTTAARVALVVTALYPPLALWAVGGLETLPAALVMTAAVLFLCGPAPTRRDALHAGAALAVLPWLRPEGVVVAVAVAVLAQAPGLLRRGDRREALVRLALAAGLPIASQLVLAGVRFAVYGHVLPNSFFYKTRAGTGLEVLNRFVEQGGPVLLVAAFGLVVARGRLRLLAVPPLVYGLGSIGTLDSVNHFSRFFLPTWPLCALLAGVAVSWVAHHLGRVGVRAAWAGALALGAALLFLMPGNARAVREWGTRYASCREQARLSAAAWLRDSTPARARFSISDSGLVPALSGDRAAIDQLGLNEPTLQRTGPLTPAQRAARVLARRPDAILLASRSPEALDPLYQTDTDLARDPRFSRRYRLATVARGKDPACRYALFAYRLDG
jgi:arabinofuranosyltransferase